MEFVGDAPRPSVAPPGWTPPVSAPEVEAHAPVVLEAPAEAADAAVRWRVRAASFDSLIVYSGYVALCAVMHWRVLSLSHYWIAIVAGVLYHFALESRDGQTVGKRRYGIQVVSVDGGQPSPKAIAIRSLMRFADQLPVYYVSGLVSMLRTGPRRRQRMGDVAAGTMVVAVGGRAARRGTPGWMLPTATILALLGSAFTIYGAVRGNGTLTGAQRAAIIQGCQDSPGGEAVDCECLLNQLEADGYDSMNQLRGLIGGGADERDRALLTQAVQACRR